MPTARRRKMRIACGRVGTCASATQEGRRGAGLTAKVPLVSPGTPTPCSPYVDGSCALLTLALVASLEMLPAGWNDHMYHQERRTKPRRIHAFPCSREEDGASREACADTRTRPRDVNDAQLAGHDGDEVAVSLRHGGHGEAA